MLMVDEEKAAALVPAERSVRLTQHVVNQLKIPLGRTEAFFWDMNVPTFGVRLTHKSKTFILHKGGKYLEIGDAQSMSVLSARNRAMVGGNPLDHRYGSRVHPSVKQKRKAAEENLAKEKQRLRALIADAEPPQETTMTVTDWQRQVLAAIAAEAEAADKVRAQAVARRLGSTAPAVNHIVNKRLAPAGLILPVPPGRKRRGSIELTNKARELLRTDPPLDLTDDLPALDEQQEQVVLFIAVVLEDFGEPPTREEMMEGLGLSGYALDHRLRELVNFGYLYRKAPRKPLTLTEQGLRLVGGKWPDYRENG